MVLGWVGNAALVWAHTAASGDKQCNDIIVEEYDDIIALEGILLGLGDHSPKYDFYCKTRNRCKHLRGL